MINHQENATIAPKFWRVYWPWILVLLVLLAVIGIIAPGRGANWFEDDGFFLALSWNAAHGFGLDKLLPQSPQYLFHALLMKVGLREYIHFRYVNYLMILLSSSLFFLGLDTRRFMSPLVPVAICMCLFMAYKSIQSPHTLSTAFFLLGAGCYFFALDHVKWQKPILLALCGTLLAIAGFMHAAVAVAMIALVSIMLIVDRSIRRSALLPFFFLASLLLWVPYLHQLGIDTLLADPAGHDSSPGLLYSRVLMILGFYKEVVFVFLFVLLFSLGFRQYKYAVSMAFLCILITIFYGATLVNYVVGNAQPEAVSGLHMNYFLTSTGQYIQRIPAAAFLLMLFATCRWLGEGWAGFKPTSSSDVLRLTHQSNEINMRVFLKTTTAKILAPFNSDNSSRKFTVAVFGIILIQSATSVGSLADIVQGRVHYAGPVIGIAILLWDWLDHNKTAQPVTLSRRAIIFMGILTGLVITYAVKINTNLMQSIVFYAIPAMGLSFIFWGRVKLAEHYVSKLLAIISVSWLTITGVHALTYNFSWNAPILAHGRVTLQEEPLRGILEQPHYAAAVKLLKQQYDSNGCRSLPMVSLDNIALVNYILQHQTHGIAVRPAYYFPEDKIEALLELQSGWCVIDITGLETQMQINSSGVDKRSALRDRVKQHSDRVFLIPSPGSGVSDIQFYVRDKH